MPIGNNLPTSSEQSFLNRFEPPPQLIEPAVRACRLFNTALDTREAMLTAIPMNRALSLPRVSEQQGLRTDWNLDKIYSFRAADI